MSKPYRLVFLAKSKYEARGFGFLISRIIGAYFRVFPLSYDQWVKLSCGVHFSHGLWVWTPEGRELALDNFLKERKEGDI